MPVLLLPKQPNSFGPHFVEAGHFHFLFVPQYIDPIDIGFNDIMCFNDIIFAYQDLKIQNGRHEHPPFTLQPVAATFKLPLRLGGRYVFFCFFTKNVIKFHEDLI